MTQDELDKLNDFLNKRHEIKIDVKNINSIEDTKRKIKEMRNEGFYVDSNLDERLKEVEEIAREIFALQDKIRDLDSDSLKLGEDLKKVGSNKSLTELNKELKQNLGSDFNIFDKSDVAFALRVGNITQEQSDILDQIIDKKEKQNDIASQINDKENESKNIVNDLNAMAGNTYQKFQQQNHEISAINSKLKTYYDLLKASLKPINIAWDFWIKIDDNVSKYNRSLGLGIQSGEKAISKVQEYRQTTLEQLGDLAKELGMNEDELQAIQEGYSNVTSKAILLNTEQTRAAAHIAQAVGPETWKTGAKAMNEMGGSLSKAQGEMATTFLQASTMGLKAADASKKFAENIKTAARYNFKEGIEGVRKMTLLAETLRIDMQSLASATEGFETIESAIDKAAQLQMLGGTFARDFANPLTAMNEALVDPEALMKKMTDQFTGKGFINAKGEFELDPVSRMQLKQAAKTLGLDYGQMLNASSQGAKQRDIDLKGGFLRNNGQRYTEAQQMAIVNTAEYNTATGRYEITLANNEVVGLDELAAKTEDEINEILNSTEIDKNINKNVEKIVKWTQGTRSRKELKTGVETSAKATGAGWFDGMFDYEKGFWRTISGWSKHLLAFAGGLLVAGGATIKTLANLGSGGRLNGLVRNIFGRFTGLGGTNVGSPNIPGGPTGSSTGTGFWTGFKNLFKRGGGSTSASTPGFFSRAWNATRSGLGSAWTATRSGLGHVGDVAKTSFKGVGKGLSAAWGFLKKMPKSKKGLVLAGLAAAGYATSKAFASSPNKEIDEAMAEKGVKPHESQTDTSQYEDTEIEPLVKEQVTTNTLLELIAKQLGVLDTIKEGKEEKNSTIETIDNVVENAADALTLATSAVKVGAKFGVKAFQTGTKLGNLAKATNPAGWASFAGSAVQMGGDYLKGSGHETLGSWVNVGGKMLEYGGYGAMFGGTVGAGIGAIIGGGVAMWQEFGDEIKDIASATIDTSYKLFGLKTSEERESIKALYNMMEVDSNDSPEMVTAKGVVSIQGMLSDYLGSKRIAEIETTGDKIANWWNGVTSAMGFGDKNAKNKGVYTGDSVVSANLPDLSVKPHPVNGVIGTTPNLARNTNNHRGQSRDLSRPLKQDVSLNIHGTLELKGNNGQLARLDMNELTRNESFKREITEIVRKGLQERAYGGATTNDYNSPSKDAFLNGLV